MGLIAAGVTSMSGCGSALYYDYPYGDLYSSYGIGVYGRSVYPYDTYRTPYAYGLPQPYSPYPPFGPTIPPW